eukprot:COSAG04_NODE_10804_length_752_cov_0.863706_1_plen_59_part_10
MPRWRHFVPTRDAGTSGEPEEAQQDELRDDDEEEYEVERILDKREGRFTAYLVLWKGYP